MRAFLSRSADHFHFLPSSLGASFKKKRSEVAHVTSVYNSEHYKLRDFICNVHDHVQELLSRSVYSNIIITISNIPLATAVIQNHEIKRKKSKFELVNFEFRNIFNKLQAYCRSKQILERSAHVEHLFFQ